MHSLHLSAGWCSKVDKTFKDFWWGHPTKKSRNYTPKAWHVICQPKQLGGLGIRCMKEINSAFLQKLGWNILTKPDQLWVKLLKAKYFPHTPFLHSVSKPGASLVWHGISKVVETLKFHLCYLPRNGATFSIRQDPWIPLQLGFTLEWLQDFS